MLSKLIPKLTDVAMVALMYFGLFVGNEYAANVFWAAIIVFTLLMVLILIILAVSDAREMMKKDRNPRSELSRRYSITFDLLFSIAFAASGFPVTAAAYFILSGVLHLSINSLDDEINEANPQ